jgi:hypothetical protein
MRRHVLALNLELLNFEPRTQMRALLAEAYPPVAFPKCNGDDRDYTETTFSICRIDFSIRLYTWLTQL